MGSACSTGNEGTAVVHQGKENMVEGGNSTGESGKRRRNGATSVQFSDRVRDLELEPYQSSSLQKSSLQTSTAFCMNENATYRSSMQDAMYFNETEQHSYYCVCDGHGGDAAAITAVAFFEEHFEQMLKQREQEGGRYEQVLEEFFRVCDAHMAEKGMEYEGCTCTIVLLADVGGVLTMFVANVGDSGCAVGQGGVSTIVTDTHNTGNKEEMLRVSDAGGFVARGRVNGVFSITRALGNHCLKAVIPSEPYIRSFTVSREHEYVCVASDGLWDTVKPHEVGVLLKECTSVQETVEALVDRALENSRDNIAVILIKLGFGEHTDGQSDPQET